MRIYRSGQAEIPIPEVSITELAFAGLRRAGGGAGADRGADRAGGDRRPSSATGWSGWPAGSPPAGSAPGTWSRSWRRTCPEWAVVFHGVLRASSIVTTLNPSYTVEEVNYQLARRQGASCSSQCRRCSTSRARPGGGGGLAVREIAVISSPARGGLAGAADGRADVGAGAAGGGAGRGGGCRAHWGRRGCRRG